MLGIYEYFNTNNFKYMFKNIIFDFDGVIADSEVLVAKAFSKYLKNLNISFSEKEFSIYAGRKTFQVIEELSKKFKILDQKKFFDDIMNITKDIYSTDLESVEDWLLFSYFTRRNGRFYKPTLSLEILFEASTGSSLCFPGCFVPLDMFLVVLAIG